MTPTPNPGPQRAIVTDRPPRSRGSEHPSDEPRRDGPLTRAVFLFLMLLGALYILNPGFGFFEFIPDITPVIGNLDEATATALVLWSWRRLFPRVRSS